MLGGVSEFSSVVDSSTVADVEIDDSVLGLGLTFELEPVVASISFEIIEIVLCRVDSSIVMASLELASGISDETPPCDSEV